MRVAFVVGLLLGGSIQAGEPIRRRPDPVVPRTRDLVQPEITRHLAAAGRATFAQLAEANNIPARFKTPLRQKAVADPWGAMAGLEQYGLDLAHATSHGPSRLPRVFDRLADFLGK